MFAKTPGATSYKVPEASGTRKDHVIRRPNEGTRVRRGSVLLACQGIFLCCFLAFFFSVFHFFEKVKHKIDDVFEDIFGFDAKRFLAGFLA